MSLGMTVTRFKVKAGCEDQLDDALSSFDNSNSVSLQTLLLVSRDIIMIHTYDTIDERADNIVAGLDWLDSVNPLLEFYGKSRAQTFLGIVPHYS